MNEQARRYRSAVKDLLYVLETLQWLGGTYDEPQCPHCKEYREDGHDDECMIAIAFEDYGDIKKERN